MKLKLLQIGFFLAIQTPSLLLAQSDEGDSTPEISISIEDGKVQIAVNLNESFRWENTRYESIKKFPQPWIGSSDIPHEIWFEEKGAMTWRQTDMMFMGNYAERIQERVEAYELVRNNLLKHALGYPETECLLKVKVQWVRT